MKKRIIIALFAMIYCLGIMAIPAAPGMIDYQQQDGTTIQIFNRGDERLHWAESLDGYTLLNNNKNKVYAIKDADGDLAPSDIIAHEAVSRTIEENNFLNTISKGLLYSELQSNLASQVRNTRMGGFPTTGTQNLLLILGNFNDTYTTYPQSNFNNMMNQSNYAGEGCFKDYYLEVSYGQLTVNTTVVGWVEVENNHDYYGPQNRWAEFVRDACQAADDLVDFAQFDNDNDGDVDGVAVIHQGRGQETTGDESDIWSHNFSLSSAGLSLTLDGKRIKDYTCQSEKAYYSMAGIGVICHEFGHNLGTPDFYDTDYQANGSHDGTGEWDIMASGAYNGGGDSPAHHNMWTKIFYGWVEPTELDYNGTFTLNSSISNQEAYLFRTGSANEYFLLENVQQTGFAAAEPGHGLIIYHADGNWINSHMNNNSINASAHQGMYIVASNNSINSGNAPYPSPGHTDFSDTSYPAISPWIDHQVDKGLTNITESGGIITFDYFDNSAYIPYAEFENVFTNQHFSVSESINLNFEIFSTIVDSNFDFVELKVNNISVTTLLSAPYEYTFNPTNDYVGHVPLEVVAFSGSHSYSTTMMIYIDSDELAFIEEFEGLAHLATNLGEWTTEDVDMQTTVDVPEFDLSIENQQNSFVALDIANNMQMVSGLEAFSGDVVVATFPIVTNDAHPAANDWLFSPALDLNLQDADSFAELIINFKGTAAEGELFNILYASNPTSISDYTTLNDTPIEAGAEWQSTSYMWNNNNTTNIAIQNVSTGGSYILFDGISINNQNTVGNNDSDVEVAGLTQVSNYPNPFNPETTINFNLGEKSKVKLNIYNIKGQKVDTLVNGNLGTGNHTIVWNGTDSKGNNVSSGMYFYQIKTETKSVMNKMILMK